MTREIDLPKDLGQSYKEVLTWLDDNYAYFLTDVLKLGKPEWTPEIPTAAVAMPSPKTQEIHYLFNPNFFETLTPEGRVFVVAHETMHLLLNHLLLFQKFVDFEKAQENTKEARGEARKAEMLNWAADAVINDYLAGAGVVPIDNVVRGEKLVGYNCAHKSVTEVYLDLANDLGVDPATGQSGDSGEGNKPGQQKESDKMGRTSEQKGDNKPGESSEQKERGKPEKSDEQKEGDKSAESGKTEEPELDKTEKFDFENIDSHDWLYGASKEEIDKAEEIYEANQGNLPKAVKELKAEADDQTDLSSMSSSAGTGEGSMQEFAQQHGVSLAWAELLKEIVPDIFETGGRRGNEEVSFVRRRKKLAAFPDTILPVKRQIDNNENKGKGKPKIILGLDVSGSCQKYANYFLSLAKSIPQNKVEVEAFVFNTKVQRVDLNVPHPQFMKGGGTGFYVIPEYINKLVSQSENKKYPQAIVVITDGEVGYEEYIAVEQRRYKYVAEKYEKNWTWLLVGRSLDLPFGKNLKLDRFVEGPGKKASGLGF
jgi:predicted metal-dependent peptidase